MCFASGSRKEDAIKLELVQIAKLDKNGTRFFYQKKDFKLPQNVPQSLPGRKDWFRIIPSFINIQDM